MQRGTGEGHNPPLNLWEKTCFSLYGKINIKRDYRNGKKNGRREDFNYVYKRMLMLIKNQVFLKKTKK